MRVDHVGLWVRDLERSRRFYEEFFGGRAGELYRNQRTGFQSYFVEFESGARLELMWKPGLGEGVPEEVFGWAHLAFGMRDEAAVDALTSRVRDAGYRVLVEPRRTGITRVWWAILMGIGWSWWRRGDGIPPLHLRSRAYWVGRGAIEGSAPMVP